MHASTFSTEALPEALVAVSGSEMRILAVDRLGCPAGEEGCQDQDTPPTDEGCGSTLDSWFTDAMLNPKAGPRRPPMTMAALPEECRQVLVSP